MTSTLTALSSEGFSSLNHWQGILYDEVCEEDQDAKPCQTLLI